MKAAKKTAVKRKPWTKEDIAVLRRDAKLGIPTSRIARALKRSLGAVYQRASEEGIRLRANARRGKR